MNNFINVRLDPILWDSVSSSATVSVNLRGSQRDTYLGKESMALVMHTSPKRVGQYSVLVMDL